MKKMLSFILIISLLTLTAVSCKRNDPTAETPKTCESCGATEGEPEMNSFQKFWLAIVNFFRNLFGLPELSVEEFFGVDFSNDSTDDTIKTLDTDEKEDSKTEE